jgi:leucine dehydrogenase
MSVFTHEEFDGHEEVVFCYDRASGLRAIIAIHNTALGPALGGCRMWPYADEAAALTDVLRLSKGMTYKSALAGLALGGGKSVILGDARTMKSEALFRAMGRFVDSLGGRYIAAEDVGIGVADVQVMAKETDHVAGTPEKGSGDPSPATAYGVFVALEAAVALHYGRPDLKGCRVAVQGLGAVGYHLAERLAAAGAELLVTDIAPDAVARAVAQLGARAVAPDAIYAQDVDVFAPCALGAVLNDETIPQLKADVIVGSANNQLAAPRHGRVLAGAGKLYAPDYLVNAGGIINISHEGPAYDRARAFGHVARIGATLREVVRLAAAEAIPSSEAADRLAERRLQAAAKPPSVAAE